MCYAANDVHCALRRAAIKGAEFYHGLRDSTDGVGMGKTRRGGEGSEDDDDDYEDDGEHGERLMPKLNLFRLVLRRNVQNLAPMKTPSAEELTSGTPPDLYPGEKPPRASHVVTIFLPKKLAQHSFLAWCPEKIERGKTHQSGQSGNPILQE